MYAIEWNNPEDDSWEVCQGFDGMWKIACIYFIEDEAMEALKEWADADADSTYRISKVKVEAVV